MKKFLLSLAAICLLAITIGASSPAAASVTLWSTNQGDLNFSGLTPNAPGAAAGPISGSTITSSGLNTAASLKVDTGTKTATATGTTTATATLNKNSGLVTSASLTTAAGGTYVLTLTNSIISANDAVFVSVATSGTGMPVVANVVPGAGQVVITIQNIHASAAFNNTLKLSFLVLQN